MLLELVREESHADFKELVPDLMSRLRIKAAIKDFETANATVSYRTLILHALVVFLILVFVCSYRVHTLFHTLSVSIVRFVVVKHNGLVSF